MNAWIASWFRDRARRADDNLLDVGEGSVFDFRDGKASLLARLEAHLVEMKVATLNAHIDYFNLAGFSDIDVKLAQAAFRQDVTA